MCFLVIAFYLLYYSSNIRPERVDEALEDIEEANKYEQTLARRADGISQNLHVALQTHNRQANEDITAALVDHARSSLMYEKQLLRELEALRPRRRQRREARRAPRERRAAPVHRPAARGLRARACPALRVGGPARRTARSSVADLREPVVRARPGAVPVCAARAGGAAITAGVSIGAFPVSLTERGLFHFLRRTVAAHSTRPDRRRRDISCAVVANLRTQATGRERGVHGHAMPWARNAGLTLFPALQFAEVTTDILLCHCYVSAARAHANWRGLARRWAHAAANQG
ncbi:hypothetical protein HWV62_33061 [Athelia sp. TMB]|nr:hypothetical protein HWV62_33061 [Athelia sp. TMB]